MRLLTCIYNPYRSFLKKQWPCVQSFPPDVKRTTTPHSKWVFHKRHQSSKNGKKARSFVFKKGDKSLITNGSNIHPYIGIQNTSALATMHLSHFSEQITFLKGRNKYHLVWFFSSLYKSCTLLVKFCNFNSQDAHQKLNHWSRRCVNKRANLSTFL